MTHRMLTRTTALTLCLALTAPGAGLAQADIPCADGNDQACENANDRGALAMVMASLAAGKRPTAGQIGQLNKGDLKKLIEARDLDIDPRGMPPTELRAAVMAELGIEGRAEAEAKDEPPREQDKAEAESGVVDELAQALTGGEEDQQAQAEVGAEALTEVETEAEASDRPRKELTRQDIDRLNRKGLLQVNRQRGLGIEAQGIGTADLRTAVKAELGMKARAKAKGEGEPQPEEEKAEAESGVVDELAQALTGGEGNQQAQVEAEAEAQAEAEVQASDRTRRELTRNDIGGMSRTQLLKVIRQRNLAIDPQGKRTGDLRNAVGRELGLMQATPQQRPEQTGDSLGDALEKAAEGAVDELEQTLDRDKAEREAELDRRRAEKDADADKPMAATGDAGTEGDAKVTTQTVTEENARSSDEEFETQLKAGAEATTQTQAQSDGDDGLSTLGKAAALGLGAIALNEILSADDEVVTSSRDRVVVRQDGQLRVLKNDDVHLLRPGNEVRTRTFDDGSTRTVVFRGDGSKIITIRAADGRVLRRVRERTDGSRVVIFDDTQHRHEPVVVRNLPEPPRESGVTYSRRDRAALEEALNAELAADVNRRFSLRQVREISAVRKLMPPVTLDAVNFRTDSAVIRPREAEDLAALGQKMAAAIDHNPDEVFLVEGHTDTVGSASYNLALSDRRAESVALALVEYFDVPPENLVIQGYGESDLAVEVRGPQRANRRATVRRITPLLHRGQ